MGSRDSQPVKHWDMVSLNAFLSSLIPGAKVPYEFLRLDQRGQKEEKKIGLLPSFLLSTCQAITKGKTDT